MNRLDYMIARAVYQRIEGKRFPDGPHLMDFDSTRKTVRKDEITMRVLTSGKDSWRRDSCTGKLHPIAKTHS